MASYTSGKALASAKYRFLPLHISYGQASPECVEGFFLGQLEILAAPGLEVCGFSHRERRREAREEVAVVLAIGHALRAHEALGRPDALSGFLEVVHSLFENGAIVGHEKSIRVDSVLPRLDGPGYPSGSPGPRLRRKEVVHE